MGIAASHCEAISIEIGRRLCALRQSRRLSQGRLGALVSISQQQIQKYESGKNEISASTLIKVAIALDYQPEEFLPRNGRAQDYSVLRIQPDSKELLEMYGALNHEQRVATLLLVDSLKPGKGGIAGRTRRLSKN